MSQYAPWLWDHFGLTVLSVWEIETLQFVGFCDFIDTQRALARREAESRGR